MNDSTSSMPIMLAQAASDALPIAQNPIVAVLVGVLGGAVLTFIGQRLWDAAKPVFTVEGATVRSGLSGKIALTERQCEVMNSLGEAFPTDRQIDAMAISLRANQYFNLVNALSKEKTLIADAVRAFREVRTLEDTTRCMAQFAPTMTLCEVLPRLAALGKVPRPQVKPGASFTFAVGLSPNHPGYFGFTTSKGIYPIAIDPMAQFPQECLGTFLAQGDTEAIAEYLASCENAVKAFFKAAEDYLTLMKPHLVERREIVCRMWVANLGNHHLAIGSDCEVVCSTKSGGHYALVARLLRPSMDKNQLYQVGTPIGSRDIVPSGQQRDYLVVASKDLNKDASGLAEVLTSAENGTATAQIRISYTTWWGGRRSSLVDSVPIATLSPTSSAPTQDGIRLSHDL